MLMLKTIILVWCLVMLYFFISILVKIKRQDSVYNQISDKQWKLIKKFLLRVKYYEKHPKEQWIRNESDIEFNSWALAHKQIPIEDLGKY